MLGSVLHAATEFARAMAVRGLTGEGCDVELPRGVFLDLVLEMTHARVYDAKPYGVLRLPHRHRTPFGYAPDLDIMARRELDTVVPLNREAIETGITLRLAGAEWTFRLKADERRELLKQLEEQ